MPFRNMGKNGVGLHDKARGMVKERSRDNFLREKKEMEHELNTTHDEIMKAMNDRYEYDMTKEKHGTREVTFFNRLNNHKKRFTIEFEENYNKLRNLWEDHH